MVRFKNRYQLVQLSFDDGSCDAGVSEKNIVMAIRAAVELMHGDFGSACLQQSLAIKYFNTATGLFIVRFG
jgi:RNase P/RNase MRP subunit POP5